MTTHTVQTKTKTCDFHLKYAAFRLNLSQCNNADCRFMGSWGGGVLLTEVELTVEFLAVDDVEPVGSVGLHVGHLEVEPLMVMVGVDVRAQNQVILIFPHLQYRAHNQVILILPHLQYRAQNQVILILPHLQYRAQNQVILILPHLQYRAHNQAILILPHLQ